VTLASFKLKGGVTVNWYKFKRSEKTTNSPSMEWKEFSKRFLKHFLSENMRDTRAYEFERLVQGDLIVNKKVEIKHTTICTH
jgi:sulfatase maturation enzyme AslB (radical SAM superfamily)